MWIFHMKTKEHFNFVILVKNQCGCWWTHPTAQTSVAAYAGRGVGQGGQLAVAGTGTSLATTSKPGGHLVICLDLAGNIRQ